MLFSFDSESDTKIRKILVLARGSYILTKNSLFNNYSQRANSQFINSGLMLDKSLCINTIARNYSDNITSYWQFANIDLHFLLAI